MTTLIRIIRTVKEKGHSANTTSKGSTLARDLPQDVTCPEVALNGLLRILDGQPDLWIHFYPGETVSFSLQVHPWWNPALGEVYQLFIEAADAIEARAKEVKAHYGKRRNQ